MRFFASGPWQAKQLSARMGRIARSKSILPSAVAPKPIPTAAKGTDSSEYEHHFMELQRAQSRIVPVYPSYIVGDKRARKRLGKPMLRAAKQSADRHCDSPFCIRMTIVTAILAAALVIYSATAILVLLR